FRPVSSYFDLFRPKNKSYMIRKNRNNRKIDFCPVLDWNLLSPNLFQLKRVSGILRLLRKNFALVCGGEGSHLYLNPNPLAPLRFMSFVVSQNFSLQHSCKAEANHD
ncbi:MAG: hypothetical protein ACLQU4_20645, partial [Limisphaerales bacterium]